MNIALKILQQVLVNYFYRVNAGFFLFAFFVLFGLPNSPLAFHLSIINGIIQSQVFIAVMLVCWLLYYFKCLNYIVNQLRSPQQSFLFCFSNLPPVNIFLYMLFVQLVIALPVLIYAAVISWFACQNHYFLCAAEVILFNTLMLCISAFFYTSTIQKNTVVTFRMVPHFQTFRLPKPFFVIPLYFLVYGNKQMLFVTKIFSLLLLFGFFRLYEPDHYDIRPIQLCLLLTAAAHTTIIFNIMSFSETYLSFARNLPFTVVVRFLQMVAMYACLLLPEMILLLKGFPFFFTFSDYLQLVSMLIALLCLLHTTLYIDNSDMESFIPIVFVIMAACFFIILYSPGILLPMSIFLLSFAFFNAYYNSYEKKII